MNKKKALFVVSNLTTGGIQSQALLIAKFLKEVMGFEVHFWGIVSQQTNYTDLLDKEGISYEMIESLRFILSGPYFALSLRGKLNCWYTEVKKLKKSGYNVILPFASGIQMNILKLLTPGVRTSFYFERGGHDDPVREPDDWYHKLVRLSKPIYLANSFHGAKALSIIKGLQEGDVHVVRNAVLEKDIDGIQEGWQKTISRNSNVLTFTMIANFFEYKDHATLIDGFIQAIKNHPNIRLLLAGKGGPQHCKDRMASLEKKVRSEYLEERIVFLGSVRNTRSLLDITDVGVLSSSSAEGCPNAILEYMSHALPVVASNIAANQEVLPERQLEYVFEARDSKDCADKIVKMAHEYYQVNEELGKVNMSHVEKEFTIEKLTNQYRQLIEPCLN